MSDQAPRGVSKRTCLEVGWPSSNRRLRTFAKRPRHVVPTRGSRPADTTLSQVAEKPCTRMHGPNRLEPTKLQTYPMDDPTKPHAFRRLVAQNRRSTLDLRAYASLSKSPPMSVIETRRHQLFPVLNAGQIDTAKRFASALAREFTPREIVYEVAAPDAPVWLVLKGSIDVVRRDGLNHEAPITSLLPGQFSGESSQLAGAATLASARAGPEGCIALPLDTAHVHALMIGSAEVGEIMMRAFILRRVALIEEGDAGAILVGKAGTKDLVRLQGFLGRNGYPYTVLDAFDDTKGRAVIERLGVLPDELPLMACPNGTILKRPTNVEVGAWIAATLVNPRYWEYWNSGLAFKASFVGGQQICPVVGEATSGHTRMLRTPLANSRQRQKANRSR